MRISSSAKPALLVIFVLSLISCYNELKMEHQAMDPWIGRNIKDLILNTGPAARTASDGGDGKIYIYATNTVGAYTGTSYYHYIFWYARKDGTIYHWMVKKGSMPPQQINVDLYIH